MLCVGFCSLFEIRCAQKCWIPRKSNQEYDPKPLELQLRNIFGKTIREYGCWTSKMDGNILQRDCTASSDSASPTTGVVVTRAHYIYINNMYL